MSDSQDTFEKDPAGWIQVGLAIAAFDIALIAFADFPFGLSVGLLFSLLGSGAFVTTMLIRVIPDHALVKRQQETRTLLNQLQRAAPLYLLSAGVFFYGTVVVWGTAMIAVVLSSCQ